MRTLKWRNKEVKTTMSDEDAVMVLLEQHKGNSFAAKLSQAFARGRTLSESQLYWIHTIAINGPKENEKEVIKFTHTLEVVHLLETARSNGLKFPKITVPATNGDFYVFSLAGEKSKYNGNLTVKRNWDETWCSILRDGTLYRQKSMTEVDTGTIQDLLKGFTAVCVTSGLVTGRCVFCYKEITDSNSKKRGYGPICARNYGLPL